MRILQTAFNPPRLSKLIERKNLLKKLAENKNKKLILLKAGPGYGKTILAATYFHQLKNKIWLTIPPNYFSLSDMLTYLIYALKQGINSKENNKPIRLTYPLTAEGIIIEIINLILKNINGPIYLFIDDFHQLHYHEEKIEKLADLFFSFIPSSVHVLITSQTDLPFSLAKLRLTDNFYQLEQDDFNLSLEEIDELLKKNNLKPSLAELNDIYHLSEGWIAILTLLINELKISGRNWKQVLNSVDNNITEYIDHLLNKLADSHKHFLIETSIFQRVKIEICNQYLNRNDSAEILNQLAADNLVYIHDQDLFSYPQLLKDNLVKKIDPTTLPEKYNSLAKIYMDYGDDDAVITCLIKSEKIEKALKIILKKAEEKVQKNLILMRRWLELLPENYFHNHPRLYFYRGQIKERIGNYKGSLLDYKKAQKYFQKILDRTSLLKVQIQIAGIYWHNENYKQTVNLCRKILPDIEKNNYAFLASLYNLLGISLIELSSPKEGTKYLEKAINYCLLNDNKKQEAWILNNLSFHLYTPSGDLQKAIKTYRKALAIFEKENDLNGKALILANLSHLYLEINQLEPVDRMLAEAKEIYLKMDNISSLPSILLLQTRLNIFTGDLISAENKLSQLQSDTLISNFQRSHLYLTYSYFYSTQKEWDQALFWVEKAIELAGIISNSYFLLEFQLQKIRIEYLQNNYLEALTLIEKLIKISQKRGYSFYLAEALFYETVIRKIINKPSWEGLQQFIELIKGKDYYFLFKKFAFLTEEIKFDLRKLLQKTELMKTILDPKVMNLDQQGSRNKSSQKPGNLLKIKMLGNFEINRGNKPLNTATWKNKKALNLLKFLILNRNQWVLQDQILDIFWPELKFEKARQNLYVALYEIRKALEPDVLKHSHYILSQKGTYRFNNQQPYWLDLEEFQNNYEEAKHYWKKNNHWKAEKYYLKAKKIYKKTLLPENIYDDWSNKYRELYQKMYLTLLKKLLEIKEKEDVSKALVYGEEILTLEPYLEDINIKIIELLIKNGYLKEAFNHYQGFKNLYSTELNVKIPKKLEEIMKKIF